MTAETVTRYSRAFVFAGVCWLVGWQAAVVLGGGRRLGIVLGLYGFVFHTVFGKAYSLVPSYFDTTLAFPRLPAAHLALALVGTGLLAVDAAAIASVGDVGMLAWGSGCVLFVGTLAWSARGNLTGRRTGTAESKADRRTVDRLANGFVPVALAYLLVGVTLAVVAVFGEPLPLGTGPTVTHLLAAGTAALLVFALGFRLLPRFLAVIPRWWLVGVVLVAGAMGPLFLAVGFSTRRLLWLGAALQTTALVGFALAYVDMFRRSDRRRVGLYAVVCSAAFAIVVAGLGVYMAVLGRSTAVAEAHLRVALLGFLGITIVGVSYQFYPPSVASRFGVDDGTGYLAVALLVAGLALEVGGGLAAIAPVATGGRWLVLLGAATHAFVVGCVFAARRS